MENQLAAANNDMNGACGYSHVTEEKLAAPLRLRILFHMDICTVVSLNNSVIVSAPHAGYITTLTCKYSPN